MWGLSVGTWMTKVFWVFCCGAACNVVCGRTLEYLSWANGIVRISESHNYHIFGGLYYVFDRVGYIKINLAPKHTPRCRCRFSAKK